MIVFVVDVGIQRLARAFSDRPEGHFAESVELAHHVGRLRSGDQIRAVAAVFEDGAVADGLDLRADELRVHGGDDLLLEGRCLTAFEIRLTLRFERIATVAEVLAELLDPHLRYLARRNRLADADLDGLALRTYHLADEPERPEARVKLAEDVEQTRILAVEVNGHDGQAGLADELRHIVRPRLVFDNALPANRCPVALGLPRSHLAGGEESQRAAICYMAQGGAYAGDASGSAAGEVVDGDEPVFEFRNQREEVGRQYLVVRAASGDKLVEEQTVDRAEVMVADGDETALGRDMVQLGLGEVDSDLQVFQDVV